MMYIYIQRCCSSTISVRNFFYLFVVMVFTEYDKKKHNEAAVNFFKKNNLPGISLT